MSLSYADAWIQQANCPFCGSSNIENSGITTTLMAWSGGDDKNPNEQSCSSYCFACREEYYTFFRISDNKIWFKDRSLKVLNAIDHSDVCAGCNGTGEGPFGDCIICHGDGQTFCRY